MKRLLSFLCACIFSLSSLYAEIIETEHFNEINQYVSPDTLVILDIDDTLLIPVQTLGSDVWFVHRLKQHQTNEFSEDKALDKALAEWEGIRHLTKMKVVEEGTEKIVQNLQNQKIVVMGLTTQGLALATRTVNQLRALNIDLCKTAPSDHDVYFLQGHGILYRQGILFTSGTPKGPALLTLFEKINYQPKRIVFINDKATHLRDVEQSAVKRGIEFIGLRYSYCDQRTKNFRSDIADVQWNRSNFGYILSDEEALELLNESF